MIPCALTEIADVKRYFHFLSALQVNIAYAPYDGEIIIGHLVQVL